MTSMKTVGLVIITTAVKVGVEGAEPPVASEAEVLTQIPSAVAKLLRDHPDHTGEDNPVLTGMYVYVFLKKSLISLLGFLEGFESTQGWIF